MRISVLSIVLLLAFCARAQCQSPLINSVDPESGKIGDVLTVQGASLGADVVAAIYLTDGQVDTKLVITEQNATSIKVQIPPKMKPGRFALMVLTKGPSAKLIEEPVKVTVEPEPGHPET